MNMFISVVVVVAMVAAVSFGASGAWLGPISDKSRSVAHEALPYSDHDRARV